MDFHCLARKELQALCKKNKIPANMTNVAMADALAALETVDGVEEILVQTESDAQNSPVRAAANTPRVPRTSVRRKTTKEEPESTKLTIKARRGRKESVSDEGKVTLPDTPAATTISRSRRAVAEGSDQAKEELSQTPAVVSTQRRKAAAARSTRGRAQIGQVKEEEKVEVKGYNTRRSTRLLEKKIEDLTLKDGEASTDSRGKSVETDLENAFDEKPEALAGFEEKNEVSEGESVISLKEKVPMESEISTISAGQDEEVPMPVNSVKRQVDQGKDEEDVKEVDPYNSVKRQDDQGQDEGVVKEVDSDNNVIRQDDQGTDSNGGEPNTSVEEVPMEPEISTISVGQDEQGQDEEVVDDIVPVNSVERQDEQGKDEEVVKEVDPYNSVKRQDEQRTDSNGGEPNTIVDVKEVDPEKKYEAFKATDEDLKDSNDVSLDETSSKIGNDTKQSDQKDEGAPVEIDDLVSLTSNLRLDFQQHVKEDTKGFATSSPFLDAGATEVDGEEDYETEASNISSIHDFEFASKQNVDLSEAQKTNGTDVKLECDLPNVDVGMDVKDVDFVTSPFTKNEIETLLTEMMYSSEKAANAESMLLAEAEGGSKTQMAETDASLDNENAEKIEVTEVATHASESSLDDHASSEGEVENTNQADANEYGTAADLHTVDIIIDNELVYEEMLFANVKIQSSDKMAVTEALSQSKEAYPAEAVSAPCESYPLLEDNATPLKQMSNPPAGFDQEMKSELDSRDENMVVATRKELEHQAASPLKQMSNPRAGFDQEMTSELDSRDENIMMARRKELDHQVASVLLQSTPSKKSSSAERMIHVFDDSSAKKPELDEILVAKSGTLQNKENNVSSAKKTELGTKKIIVANKGTPLEKKSMNYLKKMLKEKLQKEEKVRPALQLISGNCPANQHL